MQKRIIKKLQSAENRIVEVMRSVKQQMVERGADESISIRYIKTDDPKMETFWISHPKWFMPLPVGACVAYLKRYGTLNERDCREINLMEYSRDETGYYHPRYERNEDGTQNKISNNG